jgi:hypothetical protein
MGSRMGSWEPRFERIVERDVCDGQHRNPDLERHPEGFTTAYFHHPDELRGELEDADLRVEAVMAVEGPGSFRPELDGWLDDVERRDRLLRAIRPRRDPADRSWSQCAPARVRASVTHPRSASISPRRSPLPCCSTLRSCA